MIDDNFGIKDIYQGMLLARDPITINGIHYKEDDVILLFDSIQEISFRSNSRSTFSRGGFHNRELIEWSTTDNIQVGMDMGKISKLGYGLVNKEALGSRGKIKGIRQLDEKIVEDKIVVLKHKINPEYPVRVFEKQGPTIVSEILDFTPRENTIQLEREDGTAVMVDYYFSEEINEVTVPIGEQSLKGNFKFVGKFYYTDEQTSSRKTAIIEIPKLRIIENFNLRLGRNINPFISVMTFSAMPPEGSSSDKTLTITFLDKDIDGDI